ncbi:hypothetical protein GY31_14845 [Lysinibacillus sphaericus]|nr:hypothetical protein GY31_14845 [Lysinibacillus sphaericus]
MAWLRKTKIVMIEPNKFKRNGIFDIISTPLSSVKMQVSTNVGINMPVIISNGKPLPLDT